MFLFLLPCFQTYAIFEVVKYFSRKTSFTRHTLHDPYWIRILTRHAIRHLTRHFLGNKKRLTAIPFKRIHNKPANKAAD